MKVMPGKPVKQGMAEAESTTVPLPKQWDVNCAYG